MLPVLLPLAFLPMAFVAIWIRNAEKYNRESWLYLLITFLWGALIATTMSLKLEGLAIPHVTNFFILSVIIAPIIEEFSKPLVLRFIKKEIREVEDGLIYGAVAGLGFAATENLMYGMIFWDHGVAVLLSLFYVRTVGSAFLHASATALTGYGYSTKLLKKKSFKSILPYFLLAIVVHSLFNFFAFSALTANQIVGTVFAVLFAVSLLMWIRKRIVYFDKMVYALNST